MLGQSGKQSWAKVETDVAVIVDDDVVAYVSKGIWSVTFTMNAFVPIVIRRGGWLYFDFPRPGILTWWLIEMPVND